MGKKKKNRDKPILLGRELTLDQWLGLMATPVDSRDVQLFPDFCFPSSEHRDEYLAHIADRDPKEITSLLRAFVVPTGSFGGDFERIERYLTDNCHAALETEQVKRTLRGEPTWEGVTWVIDLLHRPRLAINVIHAYLAAHFWWLPDGRITGLNDAMILIRCAYLEPLHPRDELLAITPRDFELLIGLLFHRRHFAVAVTQPSRDGGFDVRLRIDSTANAESSVVECKRYTKNVGVKEVRSILGVVERERATRGLLVTTASFTRAAKSEASQTNRIELIDYDALCVLFNEHFGPDWLTKIDSIVSDAQRQFDDKHPEV